MTAPQAGGAYQPILLALGDGLSRLFKGLTMFDLDEGEHCAAPGHQVQLACAGPDALVQDSPAGQP
nr:hypothetical protein [Oceanicaulis sp. MMSF_3324]